MKFHLIWLLALTACQSNNPPLTATPPPAKAAPERLVTESSARVEAKEVDSRVDILFVYDDSRSMERHQSNLSRNAHFFVNELAKIRAISVQVGVTLAYDQIRYGGANPEVPKVCGPDTTSPGRVNWEDPGTLRVLTGPANLLPKDGRRYVTSQDDLRTILKTTLDPRAAENIQAYVDTQTGRRIEYPVLVKPFIKDSDPKVCGYGPQHEDLFTPILQAFESAELNGATNKGFFRPGALRVIFIVSDAKDASGLSARQVHARLMAKQNDPELGFSKLRVFAVTYPPDFEIGTQTPSHRGCTPDPSWKTPTGVGDGVWPTRRKVTLEENEIAKLARITQGDDTSVDHILSICDNDYGRDLVRLGTKIQKEALQDIYIPVNDLIQINVDANKKLKVFLDDLELTEGPKTLNGKPYGQWAFIANRSQIVVFGENIDWEKYPNAKIRVSYVAVDGSSPNTKPVR